MEQEIQENPFVSRCSETLWDSMKPYEIVCWRRGWDLKICYIYII
jgi:hypothetical protein